jgi:hypothetical protein
MEKTHDKKIHISTLEKGLNADLDARRQPAGTYRDAENITLSAEGGMLSAQAYPGSRLLATLMQNAVGLAVDGAWGCNILLEGELLPREAFVVFASGQAGSRIWLVELLTGVVHTPFQSTSPFLFKDLACVVLGEENRSRIYFTATEGPLFRLDCRVTPLAPPRSSLRFFAHIPYAPLDNLELAGIFEGGGLVAGAYQFAYRYVNTRDNLVSAWSPVTMPVPVVPIPADRPLALPDEGFNLSDGVYGGMPGEACNKHARLVLHKGAEAEYYNAVELAVIRHISGSREGALNCFRTQPSAEWYNSGEIRYSGAAGEVEMPIEELALESAQLKRLGALAAKDNLLFAGDITYKDLKPARGSFASARPIIERLPLRDNSAGETAPVGGYRHPMNCYRFRGHFRDEPYRYGRAYMDAQGHWSEAVPFDFSGQAANRSSGPDFKFPAREEVPLLYSEGKGGINALGLRIEGIQGHPAWARAMAIVRLPREKNVVMQGLGVNTIFAQPATPDRGSPDRGEPSAPAIAGTILPKMLSRGPAKNIYRDKATLPGSKAATHAFQTPPQTLDPGDPGTQLPYLVLYAPEQLYNINGDPYAVIGGVAGMRVEIVDAARINPVITNLDTRRRSKIKEREFYNNPPAEQVRLDLGYCYDQTRHAALVAAAKSADYHVQRLQHNNRPALSNAPWHKAAVLDTIQVTGPPAPIPAPFRLYDVRVDRVASNFGAGDQVSRSNYGFGMTNTRSLLLRTDRPLRDLSYDAVSRSAAFLNGTRGSNEGPTKAVLSNNMATPDATIEIIYAPSIFGTGSIKDDRRSRTIDRQSALYEEGTGCAGIVPIVNITKGLGEDRYGAQDSAQQYQFTSAVISLSAKQAKEDHPVSVDVWGGDCFISAAKIRVNNTHLQPVVEESTFKDNDLAPVTEARAWLQFAEDMVIFVESEVNTEYQAQQDINPEREVVYPYNFGYSVQSGPKRLQSIPSFQERRSHFPARVIYSDNKVYQTRIEGFNSFRPASFYDIEESHGKISALSVPGNNELYCLQLSAVSVIPVNKVVAQMADSSQFLLNGSATITRPRHLSVSSGASAGAAVATSEGRVFFYDARNREVKVASAQVEPLSDLGVRSLLKNTGTDVQLSYSQDRRELYVRDGEKVLVFDDRLQAWTTRLAMGPLKAIFEAHGRTLILGGYKHLLRAEVLVRGEKTSFFSKGQQSFLDLVINPDMPFTKSFDHWRIDGSLLPSAASFRVARTGGQADQQAEGQQAELRNDLFELPLPRNESGHDRLRGRYLEGRITLAASPLLDRTPDISSVITTYRLDPRIT